MYRCYLPVELRAPLFPCFADEIRAWVRVSVSKYSLDVSHIFSLDWSSFSFDKYVEWMSGLFERVIDFVESAEKSRKLVEWTSNQVWIWSNLCPTSKRLSLCYQESWVVSKSFDTSFNFSPDVRSAKTLNILKTRSVNVTLAHWWTMGAEAVPCAHHNYTILSFLFVSTFEMNTWPSQWIAI